MKRIKLSIKIVCAVLLIIFPFVSVPVFAIFSEPQFEDSFVGALDEKFERLTGIEEDKIVVVGGSSVAFGLDSSIIEKYTGMPVVNFGLYAALGTKLMLDLSLEGIKDGDLVILAPELDPQTLSLYFSSSTTLRAMDGSPDLLSRIDSEHFFSLLGASWDFLADKLDYRINGSPDIEGVYRADSFNTYGDIDYPRRENVMRYYYNPNAKIDLKPEIVDPEFIDYLNDYIRRCEQKGARVVFSYCPMNELGLADDSTAKSRAEFADFLKDSIACDNISSDIEDYVYEAGYFYDTNFHLNDAGVVKHTVNLTRDILLELGIPKAVREEIPEAPPLPESDVRFFGEDANADAFEYERLDDGTYKIVGVRPEYLGETVLTVPLGYDTYKVTMIGKSAFRGSSVNKLVIPENTAISILEDGCFAEAAQLSELWIYYPYEENLIPPRDFVGTASDFKVFVPKGSSYKTGYYWSERGLDFEYINR